MKSLFILTARARLAAALWPASVAEKIWAIILLVLALLNGLGLALTVRYVLPPEQHLQVCQAINLTLTICLVGKDFFPGYRHLSTPLANFYPVTQPARLGLLLVNDSLALPTLYFGLFSLVFYAITGAWLAALQWLLLALIGGGSSFSIRFQLSLARKNLGALVLGALPLLLAVGQGYVRAAFSAYAGWVSLGGAALLTLVNIAWAARPLRPAARTERIASQVAGAPKNSFQQVLAVYLPKAGTSLLLGLTLKALLLLANKARLAHHGTFLFGSDWLFYAALSPMISFNYANNNLFGHIYTLSRTELERVGLTARQWQNYVYGIMPAVIVDVVISVAAIYTLPTGSTGALAEAYLLSLLGCVVVGYGGSVLWARKVDKVISLSNFRPNTSLLVNAITTALCLSVFKFPSLGLFLAIALGAALSLAILLFLTLQHNAALARRLWQQLL